MPEYRSVPVPGRRRASSQARPLASTGAATTVVVPSSYCACSTTLPSLGGGALTLAILVARGRVLPRFALGWAWAQRLHDRKTGIPYGIALAAAALVALPGSALWTSALAG